MKRLFEYSTVDLFDVEYPCSCGKTHKIKSPPVFTENFQAVVSSVLKTGHVLFVSQEDVDSAFLESAEKELAKKGYTVSELFLLPFAQFADISTVSDEVLLIVSVGGNSVQEFSKRLAFERNVHLIAVPTSMDYYPLMNPVSEFVEEEMPTVVQSKTPDAIFIDYQSFPRMPEEVLASAMGRVLSKLVAVTDYYFMSRVSGGDFCKEIYNAVIRSVARVLSSDADVRSDYYLRLLSDTSMRLAVFETMAGGLRGGEHQLARTVERFTFTRTRDKRLFGENLFISSVIVSGLYASFLKTSTLSSLPPPDRSRSVVKMRTMLLIPDTYSLKFIRGYGDSEEIDRYKISVYRAEFSDIMEKTVLLLREGLFYMRRIYSDAGFFMKYYLATSEIFNLLSVAPDFVSGKTLLTKIKDFGILET